MLRIVTADMCDLRMPLVVCPRVLETKDQATLKIALEQSEPIPLAQQATCAEVVVLVRESDAARANDACLNAPFGEILKSGRANIAQTRVPCIRRQLHHAQRSRVDVHR